MRQGLLWYDDNPKRELAEKVGRAAQRYRQKFGASPDICYVHSSLVVDGSSILLADAGKMQVAALPTVLRHHFWLGQKES